MDNREYWKLARDFPHEWRALVKLYFVTREDCNNRSRSKAGAGGSPEDEAFSCEVCGDLLGDWRRLAVHKLLKHGIKNDVRCFVDDVSRCPVRDVKFHTRARLIKHVSERRVRSVRRTAKCQQLYMISTAYRVTAGLLQKLKERDKRACKDARRSGHSNVIAGVPCRRHRPSILKRNGTGEQPGPSNTKRRRRA